MPSKEIMDRIEKVEEFAESIGMRCYLQFWGVHAETGREDIQEALTERIEWDGETPEEIEFSVSLVFMREIFATAKTDGDGDNKEVVGYELVEAE